MKKIFIILVILLSSIIRAQETEYSPIALSNIEFGFKVTNLPAGINSVRLTFTNSNIKKDFLLDVKDGNVDTTLVLSGIGNFKLSSPDINLEKKSIRILPGWFSLVPPLLAIILALVIRQVLVALMAGIFIGAFFIYDFNFLGAMLRVADTFIINALLDRDHMFIMVFTLLIGGVVGIISRNGGTVALANLIARFAKNSRNGMLASWLMGIVIFFDDYANSLIVGNLMRPITDKLRISREKLSYIVDATAAPVASVVVISTWIGYELGLIHNGLASVGSTENAYDVFMQTIPFRFYPIATLFFVFITAWLQRDLWSMYRAEYRARTTGDLFEKGALIQDFDEKEILVNPNKKSKWYQAAVPIVVILVGTVVGLYYTGLESLQKQGITDYSIQHIISNSDSFFALLWASFIASIVAVLMTVGWRLLSLHDALNAWNKGVQTMLVAVIILVFAWAISDVTNQLKTADYLISILSGVLDVRLLPVLVFLFCALISFSTGTSWGTMAIVMPLVIPLAVRLSALEHFDYENTRLMIHGVVSSVLAGSVFGDHCSPIADTTILSSLASSCNHVDHVKTQLPYAVIVAVVCMFLGDIPTAYGLSPYISIIAIFGVLTGIVLIFGKKVPGVKFD